MLHIKKLLHVCYMKASCPPLCYSLRSYSTALVVSFTSFQSPFVHVLHMKPTFYGLKPLAVWMRTNFVQTVGLGCY